MGYFLESIVPWGRSFDEYVAMFALAATDMQGRILGCGDGPASFNAVFSRQGGRAVSVDPLYRFSAEDVRRRIQETFAEVLEQTRRNRHEFTWTSIKSVAELGQRRMAAMTEFLADYPLGAAQGRYVAGELPHLPFADREFDLALCSHLLFLYSEQLSAEFHLAAIKELCRVANEVRVFPLLELGARASRHLQVVADSLTAVGYSVAVVPVPYEFQRGGKEMMQVRGATGPSDHSYGKEKKMRTCKLCKNEIAESSSTKGNITEGICGRCALRMSGPTPTSGMLAAIDAPVLLMQGNPRQVVTANSRALELFAKDLPAVAGQRGGQVFDCVHSFTEAGCGKDSNCENCPIKDAIVDTFATAAPHRAVTATLQIRKQDGTSPYALQVSTEKIGELALVRIERYDRS